MADKPVVGKRTRIIGSLLGCGLLLGLAVALAGHQTVTYTSTDIFCDQACHSHPHATQSWIQSAHYSNRSGVVTHCTDCHLPPDGARYLTEKARLGTRDAYGKLFLDVSKIDWAREGQLDRALTFTYDSACLHCHTNLFSQGLSKVAGTLPPGLQETNSQQVREMRIVARRMEAHLYYQRNREKLRCVNCHLLEGHRMEKKTLPRVEEVESVQFPLTPSGFQSYTEVIPGSNIKFHMIAVPGGTLQMGSPELGACRQRDVGPVYGVSLLPFWMAQAIVADHELERFYAQRKLQAKGPRTPRSPDAPLRVSQRANRPVEGEASSSVPAPTQQAAKAYTEWLSQMTGKKYRLPTEAELEYACVADGTMPAWLKLDSRADSHLPDVAEVNPWGFLDMPGVTTEFSLDYPQNPEGAWWYSERIGVSFRVVRESENSKPANHASTR
jgi:formylglycine-generating enzyme required for sulfatase activity/nitrate/TMAO reductase-like tetraheme cytochrome c subunit